MTRLLAIIALALTACASTPKNPQAAVEKEKNACLPAAITMREGLQRHDVWSEVLVVEWTEPAGKKRGHAYAVYLYPKGKNQLWAYDRDWGSTRVRAYTNDPQGIAYAANWSRNAIGVITSAEYLQ